MHGVLWAPHSGCLYTLTTCGLNKWEVGDATEVQVVSWNACPSLFDSIADAIWVRDVITWCHYIINMPSAHIILQHDH